MFNETIDKLQRSGKRTGGHRWLWLFTAFLFAVTICPSKAHAQISGTLEVDIPFQFHVGDVKLPAGKYIIRPLDDNDLTIMEITSTDGSTAALFDVQDAQANTTPANSELIFNKYGDRYFLSKLFDEGNPDGSELPKSRYEKRVGQATAEVAHVTARRRAQQAT